MATPRNTCSHENCNEFSHSRGLCARHYQSARKSGEPLPPKSREKGLCSIEGCDKPHHALGWCEMHRARWRRYGDPLLTKTAPDGEGLKLLHSLVGHKGAECVIWPFSKNEGYGQTYYCGEVMGAHRVMCILEHGPPPTDKHHAAHGCGNGGEGCISPDHLRWATPKENIGDKKVHGREARGESRPCAKLREPDVLEIIRMDGLIPAAHLARKYGVASTTIRAIQTGKTWAYIPR